MVWFGSFSERLSRKKCVIWDQWTHSLTTTVTCTQFYCVSVVYGRKILEFSVFDYS